ncbi:MAG: nuclear transport factor 2 family protein [Gemmatimonadota bacterium]|nr:MAG: nuclear transport factor 2 family protein [Gemmatimonadota bacterium]
MEIEITLNFIDAINTHNMGKLTDLMTDDHIFVDTLGRRLRGKEKIHEEWQKFLDVFPDYMVSVTDMIQRGDVIGIFGRASGTYTLKGKPVSDGHWEIPAAWKAIVKDGRIALWQIIADFEPVRQIKARLDGA